MPVIDESKLDSDWLFELPEDSVRLVKRRGMMSFVVHDESQPNVGQGEVVKQV